MSNLDRLIAERTPVKGLGTAAGLVNTNGEPIKKC